MATTYDIEMEVAEEYAGRIASRPRMGPHALVLGPTSSGKTTALRRLAEADARWVRRYDEGLISIPRFGRYTDELFKKADQAFYFPFEVEALVVRYLQNQNASGTTVCDQGIHSIWAYARTVHADGGMPDDLYQSFFALFLTLRSLSAWPRVAVRFRCEAAVARLRVEQRGRPHELVASPADFIDRLDKSYAHVVRDFPSDVRLEVLDTTDMDPASVTDALRELLDRETHLGT